MQKKGCKTAKSVLSKPYVESKTQCIAAIYLHRLFAGQVYPIIALFTYQTKQHSIGQTCLH